jgi:phosphoribosyl-ATP pyrophosphohydrolase/phosphoribosyl-AMP cyclohydrolase/histidinol dehydrogenase
MRWPQLSPEEVRSIERYAVDGETLAGATEIVEAVRNGGDAELLRLAKELDGFSGDGPLLLGPAELETARASIPKEDLAVLERTAARIRTFAEAQLGSLSGLDIAVEGGSAGHRVDAVDRAGCYAPGGRYPLPSSVLMTAVTARVAGVKSVWVASPRPSPVTLAAAAVAGADGVLAVGGAQAIAALAFGVGGVEPCDVVVGPGNRWVTAAKQVLAGRVGIDMLAGPSELVVLADDSADAAVVAADLLAQAEHDPDALPVLVTTSRDFAEAVADKLAAQLEDLPTRPVAKAALAKGFCVVAGDLDEAIALCERLAPEHLQVMTASADAVADRLRGWGGLFIGSMSAEVLGDYGAGPNHTLPTGGVARFQGGLSVLDFVRVHTWLRLDDADGARQTVEDSIRLARMEGLEAHARAAELRLPERTESNRRSRR